MLRTYCALQLILQHIIHLIQHLFFLGSHLFLLLLVEKYMWLCINKEQRFSQLARSVCAGEENHTVNLHMSSQVGIYHILRPVTSFLCVVSAVLRIFPPTTQNLEEQQQPLPKWSTSNTFGLSMDIFPVISGLMFCLFFKERVQWAHFTSTMHCSGALGFLYDQKGSRKNSWTLIYEKGKVSPPPVLETRVSCHLKTQIFVPQEARQYQDKC